MVSLRDKFLTFQSPIVPLELPELDCTVYIRTWSVGERVAQAGLVGDEKKSIQSQLKAMTLASMSALCDESGKRLFSDSDEKAFTSKISLPIIEKIFQAALAHNGLAKDSIEDAKEDFTATQN